MIYYDPAQNPLTNEIDRPYILRSDSKGGSTDNITGSTDVTIPASPNYPPSESGASTSYFCYLPMDTYRTSTNSTSFSVRNETQGVDLVIVEPSAALSNYTCKFYSTTSERRNVLEVHVGSTSNEAGDVLSYQGIFNASMFCAEQVNNMRITSLHISSASSFVGTASFSSQININTLAFDTLSSTQVYDSDWTNSTKYANLARTFTHNLACNMDELEIKYYIATSTNGANARDIALGAHQEVSGAQYGVAVIQTSTNAVQLLFAQNGQKITSTSFIDTIINESTGYYEKVKIWRLR